LGLIAGDGTRLPWPLLVSPPNGGKLRDRWERRAPFVVYIPGWNQNLSLNLPLESYLASPAPERLCGGPGQEPWMSAPFNKKIIVPTRRQLPLSIVSSCGLPFIPFQLPFSEVLPGPPGKKHNFFDKLINDPLLESKMCWDLQIAMFVGVLVDTINARRLLLVR
jgi:hypothetical protein